MDPKLTLLREHLSYVVERAFMFTLKKPVIPINGMVRIAHDGLSLVVSAFDQETRVDVSCSCDVDGEMEPFCVDAAALHTLLKYSVEDTVTISIRKDRKRAVFKIGKSRHEFNVAADDMIIPTTKGAVTSFSIPARHIINASETVCKLINPEEAQSRGRGAGLHYVDVEDTLYIWGGSGMCMGGYKVSMSKPAGFVPFIIPTKVMVKSSYLFQKDETLDVSFDGNILTISSMSCIVRTRVPNAPYVDVYKYLVKLTEPVLEATISTGEMRMAIKRLAAHANKDVNIMALNFSATGVTCSIINDAFNQEGEEVVEYISCTKSCDIAMGTSMEYLPEAIEVCESDKTSVTVFGRKSAMLLTAHRDNNPMVFMVLPITVD